ncbi:hypothetical protein [Nakamurella sp. PAMC28650]|uniref:hypothetical protein n=1 Tax=Nakamurella sp. PAMC28650 TaxID=2762325 RepID=UPI00164D245B|nr:hypothetical protein [Nakamurella sp. PAMC28650]QNK83247.1 hypothetical protein H7F38_11735 [Nakamurella sp. PAMC28650]
MGRPSNNDPPELRERTERLVAELRGEHASEPAAIESVATKLGMGSTQTLHNWVQRRRSTPAPGRE